MLSESSLHKIANYKVTLHDYETISIKAPANAPPEWKRKNGQYVMPPGVGYVIPDVTLVGPALIGFHDKQVMLNVGYFGRLDLIDRNPMPYNDAKRNLEYYSGAEPEKGIYLSMAHCWSGNYFHWLLDTIPMLEIAEEYERKTGERVKLLLYNPPPFAIELLEIYAPGYHRMMILHPKDVGPGLRVERLLVVPTRRRRGYLSPAVVEYLRAGVKKTPKAITNNKIYITRQRARSRRVWNGPEVMGDLGYQTVAMECYSVYQQIATMKKADRVVGPHGGGLANVVFCNPGTQVTELVSPDYTNPCCWLVGEAAGMNYNCIMMESTDPNYEDMKFPKDWSLE